MVHPVKRQHCWYHHLRRLCYPRSIPRNGLPCIPDQISLSGGTDELLNWINWCRIDPPGKTIVFWSIWRLQNKFHVRYLNEDKEIKQPSITHACGHLKKRRPPSIPSVHICTKQSSPCLHFGHGSLRLSYCLRGVSLVNSLLCCGGKESGPRGPSHIMGSPFLPHFPFPKL